MEIIEHNKSEASICDIVAWEMEQIPLSQTMEDLEDYAEPQTLYASANIMATDSDIFMKFLETTLNKGIGTFRTVFRGLFEEDSPDRLFVIKEEDKDGNVTGLRWVADGDLETAKKKALRYMHKNWDGKISGYNEWKRYRAMCRTLSVEDRLGFEG